MNSKQRRALLDVQLERLLRKNKEFKTRMGNRLRATRKLCRTAFTTVDLHTHSKYSDGASTVKENSDREALVGVDFFFATDHSTHRQKRSVATCGNGSWGHESGTPWGHVGLLQSRKIHRPGKESFAESMAIANRIAEFVWLAHPCGFGQKSEKEIDKVVERLAALDDIRMEVINGFSSVDRAYTNSGLYSGVVMDRLLGMGKKVTPLGVSDAHSLPDIGNAWTGVLARAAKPAAIIATMKKGNTFASEAPILILRCNGRPMGSTVRKRRGQKLALRVDAADSLGLSGIQIISQGKVVKEVRLDKDLTATVTMERGPRSGTYYRAECAAMDGRHAFTAPIYVA